MVLTDGVWLFIDISVVNPVTKQSILDKFNSDEGIKTYHTKAYQDKSKRYISIMICVPFSSVSDILTSYTAILTKPLQVKVL